MGYNQWFVDHMFAIAPAAAYVAQWLQSFREFPPRQKPGQLQPRPRDGSGEQAAGRHQVADAIAES